MANEEEKVLITQIKKIRVNAWFGKKKHYNAADGKDCVHLWFGVPAMILNVIVGSLLVGLLSENANTTAQTKWWGAVLVLLAAVLTAVQTFFNFQKQADGHRRIASRYLILANECTGLIALCESGNAPTNLVERMELLTQRYNEITLDSDGFPTSEADYKKAKAGIEAGEEAFTEAELEGTKASGG